MKAKNKTYALPEDELRGEIYRRVYLLLRKEGGGWHAVGAAFGLGAGTLSVPVALVLGAAAWFLVPTSAGPTLHLLSTTLFVLTLPLLALGAFFLDILEKKPPVLELPHAPRPASIRRYHRLHARHPSP